MKTDQVQSKTTEFKYEDCRLCVVKLCMMSKCRFHKTASFAFVKIKLTLNVLAAFLHTFLLWGTVIFLFSLFVLNFSGVRSQPGSFLRHTDAKTWNTKQKEVVQMVTQAWPNRPFYFKPSCLPLWQISLSITQLWFQSLKIFPETAAETAGKDGGGRGI